MTERMIVNTDQPSRHPWPEDCYIQGGGRGIVFGAPTGTYRTAFVEAFPRNPNTFLRGEGPTIAAAEDACWVQYERIQNCAGGGGEHGPYEPRQYRNRAGFCTRCGAWFPRVLPELPQEQPDTSLIGRVLSGDAEALIEVVDALARVDELPEGQPAEGGTS